MPPLEEQGQVKLYSSPTREVSLQHVTHGREAVVPPLEEQGPRPPETDVLQVHGLEWEEPGQTSL